MKLFLEFNKTEAEEVFNLLKTFKIEEQKKNESTKCSQDSKQEVAEQDTPQVAEQDEKQEELKVEAEKECEQEDTEQVKQVIVNRLVDIRAVLQEKRQKGKRAEVNELVKSYGVTSLPDISTEYHAELLEKAKAL